METTGGIFCAGDREAVDGPPVPGTEEGNGMAGDKKKLVASLTICFQKFRKGKLLCNCDGCAVKTQFHLPIFGTQPQLLNPSGRQGDFIIVGDSAGSAAGSADD